LNSRVTSSRGPLAQLPGQRRGCPVRRGSSPPLSEQQYDDLVRAAKAVIAGDALAGARDLAIVLVLGDAGLRREELGGLTRAPRLRSRGAKGDTINRLSRATRTPDQTGRGRGAAVFAAVASARPATRFWWR
jgi:hypothetical protein